MKIYIISIFVFSFWFVGLFSNVFADLSDLEKIKIYKSYNSFIIKISVLSIENQISKSDEVLKKISLLKETVNYDKNKYVLRYLEEIVGIYRQKLLLSENKKKWQNSNIKNYSYKYKRLYFNSLSGEDEYFVTVTNTGGIIHDGQNKIIKSEYESMDNIFDYLEKIINTNKYSINIKYNPTYGYIENIFIDWDKMSIDEETNISIYGFTENKGIFLY